MQANNLEYFKAARKKLNHTFQQVLRDIIWKVFIASASLFSHLRLLEPLV